jgi:hypothetical protein
MAEAVESLGTLWGYREASEFFGVSPLTLRKKVSNRQVPFLKPFGPKGKVLFRPDRLRDFVEASAVEPLAPSRATRKAR